METSGRRDNKYGQCLTSWLCRDEESKSLCSSYKSTFFTAPWKSKANPALLWTHSMLSRVFCLWQLTSQLCLDKLAFQSESYCAGSFLFFPGQVEWGTNFPLSGEITKISQGCYHHPCLHNSLNQSVSLRHQARRDLPSRTRGSSLASSVLRVRLITFHSSPFSLWQPCFLAVNSLNRCSWSSYPLVLVCSWNVSEILSAPF